MTLAGPIAQEEYKSINDIRSGLVSTKDIIKLEQDSPKQNESSVEHRPPDSKENSNLVIKTKYLQKLNLPLLEYFERSRQGFNWLFVIILLYFRRQTFKPLEVKFMFVP